MYAFGQVGLWHGLRKTSFGYIEGVDTIRSSQKMNSTKKKFLALHNSSLTWFVPVWIQLKKNLDGQHLLLRGRRHNPRVQVSKEYSIQKIHEDWRTYSLGNLTGFSKELQTLRFFISKVWWLGHTWLWADWGCRSPVQGQSSAHNPHCTSHHPEAKSSLRIRQWGWQFRCQDWWRPGATGGPGGG